MKNQNYIDLTEDQLHDLYLLLEEKIGYYELMRLLDIVVNHRN